MAWRLQDNVLRGEIDNRVRGRVTGRIWLAGVESPLLLELTGNCAPDLAGSLITFENPRPIPMTTRPPILDQRGTAGEMTAVRKVRVFDIPVEEAYRMIVAGQTPPEHTETAFYLEWDSRSGCITIETRDYKVKVSEPVWQFSSDELLARAAANPERPEEFDDADWDEFRAEQLLRQSDASGERFRRLLEKYKDDPNCQRIVEREMGWTHMEELRQAEARGEFAEEKAASEAEMDEILSMPEPELDPQLEGIGWVRDQNGEVRHPVQHRAHEAMHAVLEELRERGYNNWDDDKLGDYVCGFMNVSAKLAGALNAQARFGESYDAPMAIAYLKRILEYLNDTLGACEAIADRPFFAAESLAKHRAELFGIREDILELIQQLREE